MLSSTLLNKLFVLEYNEQRAYILHTKDKKRKKKDKVMILDKIDEQKKTRKPLFLPREKKSEQSKRPTRCLKRVLQTLFCSETKM